ncbi:phage scaffolding protein [Lysinibacillus xylanilyticus]|uniref:Phage scaffolding protein n=1 Tax=Lysinibacillus xylanilyticus TaxID=582475 RepID=A0ABT4EMB3_9BACI|nr:phage scaffolding protein [Lysinibacillus xylanilyticus]MCY9546787.1 phage scaffolding protein [Lysinibacillus xylanilyticus]
MINKFNALLTLNLQYFAEDGESTTPETNPNEQESAETKLDASESAKKTFTQTQLDELIAKRIERERKKFADYHDLKTQLEKYEQKAEEQRLAELGEVEKAQEQAKNFEVQFTELTAQLEAERNNARQQAIKNEFIKAASSANIIDIDAAMALSDLSAVGIGEDGKVNGVDDVIKALVENKPYLVAKKQTQPIGTATNSGSGGQSEKTAEQLLADAAEKARQTGLLKDKAAYAQLKKQLGK